MTGAWDETFAVHHLQQSARGGDSSSGGDGSSSSWELAQVYLEQTPGRVNAVEFLPAVAQDSGSSSGNGGLSTSGGNVSAEEGASGGGIAGGSSSGSLSGSSGSGNSFLVAVQGSNYLRQLSISNETTADAAGADSGGADGPAAVREERRIK